MPLLFIKRLSDVFDDEVQRLAETYGDRDTALEVLNADHSLVRFYLPPESRWAIISSREAFTWPEGEAPKTLGEHAIKSIGYQRGGRTSAWRSPSLRRHCRRR